MPTAGSFTLPDGETARIEFQVDIDPTPGAQVCNQGSVSGTNITGDPVLTGDPDETAAGDPLDETCTPIVFNADLGIVKTSPDPVLINASFDYTITVTNTGPDGVPAVTVTDTVPGDLTVNSTNGCTNDGANIAGQVVTCELGSIANGANAVFAINVTAPGAPVANVSNTATIATVNNNAANDNSTVVIQVVSTFTVTINAMTGDGTVTDTVGEPGTINCTMGLGGTCTDGFTANSKVELTAAPDAGWRFDSWSGCPAASGTDGEICTIDPLTGAQNVGVTFIKQFTLMVVVDGSGDGTVTGTGINCGFGGADCDEIVDTGTVVVLTAAAEAGSVFDSWTNCDSEAANVCTQTVGGDETVTATFLTPEEATEAVGEGLQAIVDANPDEPVSDKIEDSLASVATALAELEKMPPDGQAAMGAIEGAVGDREAALGLDLALDAEIEMLRDRLVEAARGLAQAAVNLAIEESGDPEVIEEAEAFLDQGDILRDAGAAKDAVSKYKDALAKAESA